MKELTTIPPRLSGLMLFKTDHGYFKNGWAILTGNELYLYNSKAALTYCNMFVLTGSKLIGNPAD
jgi:hypothetical protein